MGGMEKKMRRMLVEEEDVEVELEEDDDEEKEWTDEDKQEMLKKMKEKHLGMQDKGMFEDMYEKMGGKAQTGTVMQTGGCQESLCCGNVLKSGVWGTTHICNDAMAITYENFRFACVEGAKNLAASAVGLLAAAYYMASGA